MNGPGYLNKNGKLLTLQQTCEKYNLGSTMVRKLAKESGAACKIGRTYRIIDDEFFQHLKMKYVE